MNPNPVNDFVDVKTLGEAATVISGNFQEVSKRICKKLPTMTMEEQQILQRSVFKYETTHMFFILRDQKIVYLCMTKQPIGSNNQDLPFQLLNDIRTQAVRKYRDSMHTIHPDEMQVTQIEET
jgi:hypothetical protein